MALRFALNSTHYVDFAFPTSYNNLNTWSKSFWYRPLSGFATFRAITGKNNPGVAFRIIYQGSSTAQIACDVKRSGGTCSYVTNNAGFVANIWNFVHVSFDINAAAGEIINIYVGTELVPASECTYGTATDSSGSLADDTVGVERIGNTTGTNNQAMDFAYQQLTNRAIIDLEQIREVQYRGIYLPGCLGYWKVNDNGSGKVLDLTGNAHGTISGPVTRDSFVEGPNVIFLRSSI